MSDPLNHSKFMVFKSCACNKDDKVHCLLGDKVRGYVCGHVINKDCFNGKGKPILCIKDHPLTRLDWYRIPYLDENCRLVPLPLPGFGATEASTSHHASTSHPQPNTEQNLEIVNESHHPSYYMTKWRAITSELCAKCGDRISLEERESGVWHMETELVYHAQCARELCTQNQDQYTLKDFIMKGNYYFL